MSHLFFEISIFICGLKISKITSAFKLIREKKEKTQKEIEDEQFLTIDKIILNSKERQVIYQRATKLESKVLEHYISVGFNVVCNEKIKVVQVDSVELYAIHTYEYIFDLETAEEGHRGVYSFRTQINY